MGMYIVYVRLPDKRTHSGQQRRCDTDAIEGGAAVVSHIEGLNLFDFRLSIFNRTPRGLTWVLLRGAGRWRLGWGVTEGHERCLEAGPLEEGAAG